MRRRARACALQILYQLELSRDLSAEAVREPAVRSAMARFWHHFESLSGEDEAFAETLVTGVARHVGELDKALGRCSRHWRLSRMDKVDLSVLRLAAFELLHCPQIPRNVAINEAIELAKQFSGEESASFVNGLLDQLAPERRTPSDAPALAEAKDEAAPDDDTDAPRPEAAASP